MRAPAVLAVTAAGVLFTATAAIADTPTPAPTDQAWTVIDHRDVTLPPTAGARLAATHDAPSTTASRHRSASRPTPTHRAATPARLPHVTRTDPRPPADCQTVRGGVWRVRPGDTLWRIAVCTGHDLTELITLNDLPDGGRLIFPGDPITVA